MQPSLIFRRASWRSFSHEQPQTKLRPRLPSLSGCVQMDRKLIWFFTCKKRVSVESARVPKWIWSISFFRGFEDGKWVSSIGLWRHGLTMKWDFTALAVRRRPQPFLLCSSSRTEEVTVQLRDSWSGFSVATRQENLPEHMKGRLLTDAICQIVIELVKFKLNFCQTAASKHPCSRCELSARWSLQIATWNRSSNSYSLFQRKPAGKIVSLIGLFPFYYVNCSIHVSVLIIDTVVSRSRYSWTGFFLS